MLSLHHSLAPHCSLRSSARSAHSLARFAHLLARFAHSLARCAHSLARFAHSLAGCAHFLARSQHVFARWQHSVARSLTRLLAYSGDHRKEVCLHRFHSFSPLLAPHCSLRSFARCALLNALICSLVALICSPACSAHSLACSLTCSITLEIIGKRSFYNLNTSLKKDVYFIVYFIV